MATYELLGSPGAFILTGSVAYPTSFISPPVTNIVTGQTLEPYISTTWPANWSWDYTSFTFDSTDAQWSMDGGAVRGGTDPMPPTPGALSVTRTENIRW